MMDKESTPADYNTDRNICSELVKPPTQCNVTVNILSEEAIVV